MVVDSRALLAILFGEAEAGEFLDAVASPGKKLMSSLTRLESSTIAFDSGQAEIALDAWRRYGKGRHPANLNLGDCVAYALASVANDSLLFKGEDFEATDVARERKDRRL
jgi:ribonuclease VapC